MPVLVGAKSEGQKFPGAVYTLCIEALMQDRKALQAGTSHFLGQNFSKAQEIKFLNQEGKETFAWTTSWGVSTRLVGALIMTHSDDDGLVLPPRLAPAHVVILPIFRSDEEQSGVLDYCRRVQQELAAKTYDGEPVRVILDTRDLRGGEKTWQHIKRGVPLRLEIGPRDVAGNSLFVGRRDTQEKKSVPRGEVIATIDQRLTEIQAALFNRALALRATNTREIDNRDDFVRYFTPKNEDEPEIHGGFALAHVAENDPAVDELLKELKVTIRCLPVSGEIGAGSEGPCIFTGNLARRVVLAKAY